MLADNYYDEFYRDKYKVSDLDKRKGSEMTLREYLEQFRDFGYYDSELNFDTLTDRQLNHLVDEIEYLEAK